MIINIIYQLINVYTGILIIYALMSWVPSIRNSQIGQMITKISRPYLSIFDRLPLAIGGLDFTVVIAVISLQFIQRFIILIVG